MTMQPTVVACVVTFNPGDDLAGNLRALKAQIPFVVVVDNASDDAGAVAECVRQCGCLFIGNPRNLGVAAALNQGIEAARAQGASWLATFDQDSAVPEGAVDGLFRFLASYEDSECVGMLSMTHLDRGTRQHYHHALDILEEAPQFRRLRTAITSGSLLRLGAVDEVGGFDEGLFIDSVDHELCLRLRAHDWTVLEVRAHVLAHSIGAATRHRVLGRGYVATHHTPSRRYYMTRNQLEVARRYLLKDPVWALKAVAQLVSMALAIVIFEKDAVAKLRAMCKGVRDFVARRFGPIA